MKVTQSKKIDKFVGKSKRGRLNQSMQMMDTPYDDNSMFESIKSPEALNNRTNQPNSSMENYN